MIPIKQLFDKIKWDDRERPKEYIFYYMDRISQKLIPIKFDDILAINGTFLKLNREEETLIPLHRIKKVSKNNKIIWER